MILYAVYNYYTWKRLGGMKQKTYVQKKINLSQKVYIELKKDIYRNRIKPGDCLSENLIASEFNMSRTPVREALRMLENEDLVEIKDGMISLDIYK